MDKKTKIAVVGAVIFLLVPVLIMATIIAPIFLGVETAEMLQEWFPIIAMFCIVAGPLIVLYALIGTKSGRHGA